MANPNLLGISNVVGVTTNIVIGTSSVGTGYQTVLSNANSSGKVLKLVSILATNKTTGNSTIDINLNMEAAGAGTSTSLSDGLIVPGRAVQIVIDKNTPIYVMENRSIVAAANTSTDITISYEDIS
jgi:hypothetical protein